MESFVYIIIIVFLIFVFFSEMGKKNKEIERAKNDWSFCKKLLDKTRSVLSEEQKKKLEDEIIN